MSLNVAFITLIYFPPIVTVWIIGDSYVQRGAQRAPETLGWNLSMLDVCVCWVGCGSCGGKDLSPSFSTSCKIEWMSSSLIIHCGCNDIREVIRIKLVIVKKEDRHSLHLQHPGMFFKGAGGKLLPIRRR